MTHPDGNASATAHVGVVEAAVDESVLDAASTCIAVDAEEVAACLRSDKQDGNVVALGMGTPTRQNQTFTHLSLTTIHKPSTFVLSPFAIVTLGEDVRQRSLLHDEYRGRDQARRVDRVGVVDPLALAILAGLLRGGSESGIVSRLAGSWRGSRC
jgi:hypothetical protein